MWFKINRDAGESRARNQTDGMLGLTEEIFENVQSFEDLKRAILSIFLKVFVKDGIIPISFLVKHITDPSQHLARAIEELVRESLILKQCDSNYGIGIKLTAKGALKLGLRVDEARKAEQI